MCLGAFFPVTVAGLLRHRLVEVVEAAQLFFA